MWLDTYIDEFRYFSSMLVCIKTHGYIFLNLVKHACPTLKIFGNDLSCGWWTRLLCFLELKYYYDYCNDIFLMSIVWNHTYILKFGYTCHDSDRLPWKHMGGCMMGWSKEGLVYWALVMCYTTTRCTVDGFLSGPLRPYFPWPGLYWSCGTCDTSLLMCL